MYGWSGSKGGVSNEAQAPKYRVGSNGQLMLAEDKPAKAETVVPPKATRSNSNGSTRYASGSYTCPVES